MGRNGRRIQEGLFLVGMPPPLQKLKIEGPASKLGYLERADANVEEERSCENLWLGNALPEATCTLGMNRA